MSNNLSRYGGNRRLPARTERAVRSDLHQVQGQALVAAARVQATEYVAYSALRAVADLTDMEALAVARNPHGAARYGVIVNVATGCLAQIVADMGRS